MLLTTDFTKPLPVRRSFPKPLSPVRLFGYNPHRPQASASHQPVLPGGSSPGVVGPLRRRPAGWRHICWASMTCSARM